jgi:hypothetical protein
MTESPVSPHIWSEADFLTVNYRADLNLLVCRWQRPVVASEFQQGSRTMLRAAQESRCAFWLLDVRGRSLPEAATLDWFRQEFLPQLAEHLGRPACLGFLLSPNQLRQRVPVAADAGACMAFFAEEGPLTAWLTQCQHRSRAALLQAGFTPPPPAA